MRPRDRLLVVLGVCLPVPVFAATGLSLPLPATVERMATELVPFAQPVTTPTGGIAGGSIVLTEAELRQTRARRFVSRVAVAPESPPAELNQRQKEEPAHRSASPSRRDETRSVPVERPVTPDAAPVALPPLTPPADEGQAKDSHERGQEPKPKHERKPRQKAKHKPKHEPDAKPKQKPPKKEPKPKETPQPEEKPKPPRPKHDSEDEPAAKSGEESAEKDNGPDAGKPSGSERRPSR
jgi:hypothetical protein